jgi:hypothetical protein
VSGYGLDDRAIEVRSPAEAKDFSSSLCVQNDSGASCTVGTGDPFPGAKVRPGRDADHSLPSSAGMKFRNKKFQYGTQVCTGLFRALVN